MKRSRSASSPALASDAARRKALADAAAGVIGSLVSVLAFYPVDVWKTSLQAGVKSSDNDTTTSASASGEGGDQIIKAHQQPSRPSLHSTLAKVLPRLFRGLPHKIVHTIVSSFTYFFVYSLVQTKYASYRHSLLSSRSSSGKSPISSGATPTATKLLLTAFAAVINTGITLPLDTISSRKQAGTSTAHSGKSGKGGERMKNKGRGVKENNGSPTFIVGDEDDEISDGFNSDRGSLSEEYHSASEHEYEEEMIGSSSANQRISLAPHKEISTKNNNRQSKQSLYIKSPEKYRFSFSTNLVEESFGMTTTDNDGNSGRNEKKYQQLQSILSLWNGLFPAILLCTNPAIQYTMFDTLKNAMLQHRWVTTRGDGGSAGTVSKNQQQQQPMNSKLSMWEAFLFGIVSKFIATILTYPLIRCKVMLMVSSPDAFAEEIEGCESSTSIGKALSSDKILGKENGNLCNGTQNGHRQPPREHAKQQQKTENKKYPRSLPLLLVHIFRNDGIRGIYKGCSLQLLHTILKSALMMMVREKITFASHSFFQVDADGGVGSSS